MKTRYPWHQKLLDHVFRQLQMSHLPHAMFFRCRQNYFDDHIGWELAQLILCDAGSGSDGCKHCHLATEKTHPNIIFLDVLNEKVGIDGIRQLEQRVWQTSLFDKPKVVFIHGIDGLSKPAQNALLKTLEEPPKQVIFILSAVDISAVLATIMSRVQRLKHERFQPADLSLWLARQVNADKMPKADIARVIKLSDNQPQLALTLLSSPEDVRRINEEKQQFVRFLSRKYSAEAFLAHFDYTKTDDGLRRLCRYTEDMIRFLFEKKAHPDGDSAGEVQESIVWHGLSLRDFYRLRDILVYHQRLRHTNVNMAIQLTTSLAGWQNDRESDREK